MLTNKKDGVLYVGVNSNLVKRVYEDKNKFVDGFSKRYNLSILVYYELFADIKEAIIREKRLKKWKRDWKLELINNFNPEWKDLYFDIAKN